MIGYVNGEAKYYSDYVLVMTSGGVGYKVYVAGSVLGRGASEVELFIHTFVKEDRLELYGFPSEGDLRLFEMLIGVSGCGPKMALAISEAGAEKIVVAVQQASVSFFTAFPRVGKKVAQKLIIELKGKLGGIKELDLAPKSPVYQDAYEALLALGVAEQVVERELAELDLEQMETQAVIKWVLQAAKK